MCPTAQCGTIETKRQKLMNIKYDEGSLFLPFSLETQELTPNYEPDQDSDSSPDSDLDPEPLVPGPGFLMVAPDNEVRLHLNCVCCHCDAQRSGLSAALHFITQLSSSIKQTLLQCKGLTDRC